MSALHAGIVLAAGASRRMGQPKQLIEVDGVALVRRAALALLATSPTRVLVVVGADADAVFAAIADLPVERVDCPAWEEGMAASLRAGVAALQGSQETGVMLVLCDQPALDAAHLIALHAAWMGCPTAASASAYADTLGVPALLPRTWFSELGALQGDHGARDLLRNRHDRVTAVQAPALARDLDWPGDLR